MKFYFSARLLPKNGFWRNRHPKTIQFPLHLLPFSLLAPKGWFWSKWVPFSSFQWKYWNPSTFHRFDKRCTRGPGRVLVSLRNLGLRSHSRGCENVIFVVANTFLSSRDAKSRTMHGKVQLHAYNHKNMHFATDAKVLINTRYLDRKSIQIPTFHYFFISNQSSFKS